MREFQSLAELTALVGQHVATSDWFEMTQERIDRFGSATGDEQWIHCDPQRAQAGPFGHTIAHGFLTLSMLSQAMETAIATPNTKMALNYGLNRVRFMSPVPSGRRIRGHFKLLAAQEIPPLPGAQQGIAYTFECSMELEGAAKPACIAESLVRLFE